MPSKAWSKAVIVASATVVLLAFGAATGAAEKTGQARPNILYVMTDQQPLSCVGAYGNPKIRTPELDKLAREGCVFRQFYIAAFPCSPSRACMFSGRYSHNHGVLTNNVLLDDKVPCLGDICRPAGYRTAYFGKWHLGGNMYRSAEGKGAPGPDADWFLLREPDDNRYRFKRVPGGLGEDQAQHGFDTWVGGWRHYRAYLREVGLGQLFEKKPQTGNHNDAPSGREGTHMYSLIPREHHMASFLARHAERFIRDQQGKTQPWCAVLSFYGPHLPVAPPKPWDTMYALDDVTLPANHRDALGGKPAKQKTNEHCYVLPEWNDDQFKDYIRRYWGYCSYIDEQIGRVFKALRDTNQWDNTIIVFTSDHGDMVGAHGMIYKLTACGYEELFHVPAIIRIPGTTKPGSRTDALASNIDLLPTLLEASHVTPPDGIDGRSLVPVLKGEARDHRKIVFASSADREFICCDGRHKFVLNRVDDDLDELYDLQTDPGEMNNLAHVPEHKTLAARMTREILSWLRDTNHPYASAIAARLNGRTKQATKQPG